MYSIQARESIPLLCLLISQLQTVGLSLWSVRGSKKVPKPWRKAGTAQPLASHSCQGQGACSGRGRIPATFRVLSRIRIQDPGPRLCCCVGSPRLIRQQLTCCCCCMTGRDPFTCTQVETEASSIPLSSVLARSGLLCRAPAM